MPIAHDCTDGFLCAWWQRPLAYLEAEVRANISSFAAIAPAALADAARAARARRRRRHLGRRNADLIAGDEADFGYRLLVATRTSGKALASGPSRRRAARSAWRHRGWGAVRPRGSRLVAVRRRKRRLIAPERSHAQGDGGARSIPALAIQASEVWRPSAASRRAG